MPRSAAVVVSAVVLLVGVAACGAPTTSVSAPSSLPNVITAAGSPGAESASAEVAPTDSVLASSSVASAPLVPEPSEPVESPQNVGDLEDFVQASATTWWATVVGDLSDRVYVVRTVDAGLHWQDVTPSIRYPYANAGVSSFVLSASDAWLGIEVEPTTSQLFRTNDGGRSWEQVGSIPNDCALQFVDLSNGWCVDLQGAMGSMGVQLYRTQDGGVTWQSASRTTGDGITPGTVDALPFGCDKQLTFTSANVAWASSFCAGGDPYLDISTDGGGHWRSVTLPPFPAWTDPSQGEGLSTPVVDGKDLALIDLGGSVGPGDAAINTSSDDGRSWRVHPLPSPSPGQYWAVDLIDPTDWRATDGSVIVSTDDAGAHWSRWTPPVSMRGQGALPLNLDFISPEIGSASDAANRIPLWSTTDGGHTWTKVVIEAGPYVLN